MLFNISFSSNCLALYRKPTFLESLFSTVLKSTLNLQKYLFICLIESSLKMMKNVFYFVLKAFFVPKVFKFLSRPFGHAEKTASLKR